MKAIIVALAATLLAAPALATEMGTMICRNGIVSKGEIQGEVLAKCGEPAQKSQREEKRFDRRNAGAGKEQTSFSIVTVNEWTYNFGPNEFMQRLIFEDGRLIGIESLGYGY